jgi:hypothetical protein
MKRLWLLGALLMAVGCSSDAPAPVDPLAAQYCTDCCVLPEDGELVPCNPQELGSCERLITRTLNIVCPETTRSYYECVTQESCDTTLCDEEWSAREVCMGNAPED